MKLNEELVVRLLDGSGRYMHMQVGNDNLVLGSKHDMYVDYTILDRNLVELDGGEFDFDSSKYAKVNLKTFIPEVIRFAYGRTELYPRFHRMGRGGFDACSEAPIHVVGFKGQSSFHAMILNSPIWY